MKRKPDYGIDSPAIVAFQFAVSALAFGVAILWPRLLHLPARWIGIVAGLYFLNGAAGMVRYSKTGKIQLRDRLLDLIAWRGDEMVLDVGCGKGLLLAGAARRLTTGKAIGVDLWLPHAVSGNAPEAAMANAAGEGVAGRVEVRKGDVRELPFDDASFDVVLSNFVVHEMQKQQDRERMLREMVRVLKPGGLLALIDFIFTAECVRVLREAGAGDAARSRIGGLQF